MVDKETFVNYSRSLLKPEDVKKLDEHRRLCAKKSKQEKGVIAIFVPFIFLCFIGGVIIISLFARDMESHFILLTIGLMVGGPTIFGSVIYRIARHNSRVVKRSRDSFCIDEEAYMRCMLSYAFDSEVEYSHNKGIDKEFFAASGKTSFTSFKSRDYMSFRFGRGWAHTLTMSNVYATLRTYRSDPESRGSTTSVVYNGVFAGITLNVRSNIRTELTPELQERLLGIKNYGCPDDVEPKRENKWFFIINNGTLFFGRPFNGMFDSILDYGPEMLYDDLIIVDKILSVFADRDMYNNLYDYINSNK